MLLIDKLIRLDSDKNRTEKKRCDVSNQIKGNCNYLT